MDFWDHLAQTIYTEAGLVALLLFIGILGMIALYRQARSDRNMAIADTKEAYAKLERMADRFNETVNKFYVLLTSMDGRIK